MALGAVSTATGGGAMEQSLPVQPGGHTHLYDVAVSATHCTPRAHGLAAHGSGTGGGWVLEPDAPVDDAEGDATPVLLLLLLLI